MLLSVLINKAREYWMSGAESYQAGGAFWKRIVVAVENWRHLATRRKGQPEGIEKHEGTKYY
jgi:hypothetical protein